jgi:fructan beta-fructosidase
VSAATARASHTLAAMPTLRHRTRAPTLVVAVAALVTTPSPVVGQTARTPTARAESGDASDPWRPRWHFTTRRHWLNDPNGPVWHDGRFHLYFQHNPRGAQWGNMSWGHATSVDLVRWTEHGVAIPVDATRAIFSGSVVRDATGRAAPCARARPCLVALFTAQVAAPRAGAGRQQQHAASSTDGFAWRPWAGDPVLDIGRDEFRDPWVWRDSSLRLWRMAVALPLEHRIAFYRSRDLVRWEPTGSFGPSGATGGAWECPVVVRLPVTGGGSRWLLKVDLNPGHPAGGSGAQYWIGDVDARSFVPLRGTGARWVDGGPDFYCALPWIDGPPGVRGEAAWIGWMSDWRYAARTPTGDWRGAMTVARTLSLAASREGPVLRQAPVPALATLRGAPARRRFGPAPIVDVTPLATPGDGTSYEVQLVLRPGRAREVGLLVRRDPRGAHLLVAWDAVAGQLVLDRRPGGRGDVHAAFTARYAVPLAAIGGTVTIRVLVDRSSVEVFGGDGRAVLTALAFPAPDATGLGLFSKGGPIESLEVTTWPLRAAR